MKICGTGDGHRGLASVTGTGDLTARAKKKRFLSVGVCLSGWLHTGVCHMGHGMNVDLHFVLYAKNVCAGILHAPFHVRNVKGSVSHGSIAKVRVNGQGYKMSLPVDGELS